MPLDLIPKGTIYPPNRKKGLYLTFGWKCKNVYEQRYTAVYNNECLNRCVTMVSDQHVSLIEKFVRARSARRKVVIL